MRRGPFVVSGVSQAAAMSLQRGWDALLVRLGWGRPGTARAAWCVAVCWLLTMQSQIVTLVVFVDSEHCGLRVLRELVGRLI